MGSRATTAARLRRYWRGGSSTPSIPVDPGTWVGIGDQGSFNELTITATGLEPAPTFGNTYAPFESISAFSDGCGWANTTGVYYPPRTTPQTSSEPFLTNRLNAWGPYRLWETAAANSITLSIALQGGSNASQLRIGMYTDNGNMTDTTEDVDATGALPVSLVGMSAELTVLGNAAATTRTAALAHAQLAPGHYWFVVWRDSVSTGAELLTYPNANISRRVRGNVGSSNYSSAGAAPTNYPTSVSTNNRVTVAMFATYSPLPPSTPTGVTVTPTGNRCMDIVWTGTDSRVSRYRVERQKNGGSWVTAAIVEGRTTYTDRDLQDGATYAYRVIALYLNVVSAASTSASAVAGGVRTATVIVIPTILINNPDNTLRGNYGQKHNLSPIVQYEAYSRTDYLNDGSKPYPTGGRTEWGGIQRYSSTTAYDWTRMDDWLDGVSATSRATVRWRCVVPNYGNHLPPFITANSAYYVVSGGDYCPQWNNSYVWARLQDFIAALGARYGNDQRIAIVKVGLYNRWGEWSGDIPVTATVSRQIEMIAAMLAAFPNKKFVMSLADSNEVMRYCLGQPQIIGFEQLSLGNTASSYMWAQVFGDRPPDIRKAFADMAYIRASEHHATYTSSVNHRLALRDAQALKFNWNSAWNMGSYSSLTGQALADFQALQRTLGYRFDVTRAQVPDGFKLNQPAYAAVFWQNTGNGRYPPVEVRRPQYELRNPSTGALVWSSAATAPGVDLSTLYPSSDGLAVESVLTVSDIPTSTYDLCLRVPPPTGDTRAGNLNLGISGQQSGGYYVLKNGVVVS